MARPREFDRQAALQIAMGLFWRRGFEGVTVADLTAAMGIGAPSFYAAFSSKADLYRESLTAYQARSSSVSAQSLREDLPLKSAIEGVLNAVIRNVTAQSPSSGCMISNGLINVAPDLADLAELTASLRRDLVTALMNRFCRAVQQGELPEDVRPQALARYFAALIQGISIQARDGASQAELESMVALAIGTLPWRPRALPRVAVNRVRGPARRASRAAPRVKYSARKL